MVDRVAAIRVCGLPKRQRCRDSEGSDAEEGTICSSCKYAFVIIVRDISEVEKISGAVY